MRRILGKLVVVATVAAVAGTGFLSYRNKAMDTLYDQAVGVPASFRGTKESESAVRKLATYRGRRSTTMLVDIALGRGPLMSILSGARMEAISALSQRKDPQVAVSVASLLQPHEGLDIREAAAKTLQEIPCPDECVKEILHYLERVFRGELNAEDKIQHLPGSEDTAASVRKTQQALYETLYLVLIREKPDTLTNLSNTYGVGSSNPSPFGLDLVSRLHLAEACPLLLQSDHQLSALPSDFYNGPRTELQTAITKLNCK